MPPTITRLLRSKLFLITGTLLVIYTLLGFLLVPYLIERNVPVYAQEQLQRQASVGKVRVNPLLFSLEVNDFKLLEADGQPIATAQQLLIDFETSSLLRWAWTFADLRITGLDLHWSLDATGRSNLSKLGDNFPAGEEQTADPSAVTRLLLQHAQLIDGKLHYKDQSLATPASTTLAPINLELKDLSTLPEQRSPYAIIATLPEGGKLVWRGEITLEPISSEGELYINGFKPTALWTFLQDQLRIATPKGVVEFYTRYNYAFSNGQNQLGLQKIFFKATDLDLSETGKENSLLSLESFAARGGEFDLTQRTLTFPKVAARNGLIAVTVLKDGSVDWARLVKPGKPSTAESSKETPDSPWDIQLDTLLFENLGVQYTDMSRSQPLALAIKRLDASTQLSIDAATTANQLEIKLADIALTQSGQDPLLSLAALELSGAQVDTAQRTIKAQQMVLNGGVSNLVVDKQGILTLSTAFNTPTDNTDVTSNTAKNSPAGNAWKLQLATLQAKAFRTSFTDQRYEPALHYDVEDFNATIKNLSTDDKQAANFEATANIKQGGTLDAAGTFLPNGSHAEATLKADKISLTPLKSLIEHHTTLTLNSGEASVATQLVFAQQENTPALRLSGAANIDNLLLNETSNGDRFLSWDSLATKDLDFSLAPDRLTIKQLRMVQPGAKIVIFKDRSLNLGKIMKPGTDSTKTADDEKFPVSIDRIRIDKGNVDFSDLSLILPFAAKIENLNGAITGIAPEPTSRANIKLEGRVDEYGSVQVDGGLSPFAPKQYTDIRTRFKNIEMTPLSAYTATFAGRKIASGKLSLDLEYKVKNSELASNNTIVLDQFTLGEKIESPDALDLPLDLAIALLTDSQGKINTAVPVTGNVDSPTFSLGKIIGQAITGMLGKIVTAPFRALGGLLGGNAEKLDSVAFNAGDTDLQPPQIETLKKIGQALQKRPQLGLTVSGRYDPKLDGAALRSKAVRQQLATALNISLDADEEAPPAAVDQAKTQRELEALLETLAGNKAVDIFKADFEKSAGRIAEPANPALALLGKASQDVEYYQAMFEHLVTLQPLDDADLKGLAQQRADIIIQTLVTQADLTASRITSGKIETTRGSQDQGIDSKLILGASNITNKI